MSDQPTPEAAPAAPTPEAAPAPDVTPDGDPITPVHGERSISNALDRAFSRVDTPRNEDGTFAERQPDPDELPNPLDHRPPAEEEVEAQPEAVEEAPVEAPQPEETPFSTAPDRFSYDAKAVWDDAPLSVRAEVHRMQEEMTNGIEKYRERADAYGEFENFHEQLKQNGQRFEDVVAQYTGIENMLRQNPIQGLDQICRNMNTNLLEVARHVLGANNEEGIPDQSAEARYLAQQNAMLTQRIEALTGDVQNIRGTITQQTEAQVLQQINEFATANPRFTELEDQIGKLLETGMASNLPDAYAMAERLNPAPAPIASQAPEPTPAPTAQTQAGQLSPTGTPPSGSNPHDRKPADNPRQALDNAFDRVFG